MEEVVLVVASATLDDTEASLDVSWDIDTGSAYECDAKIAEVAQWKGKTKHVHQVRSHYWLHFDSRN